jgi:hypothetical protein
MDDLLEIKNPCILAFCILVSSSYAYFVVLFRYTNLTWRVHRAADTHFLYTKLVGLWKKEGGRRRLPGAALQRQVGRAHVGLLLVLVYEVVLPLVRHVGEQAGGAAARLLLLLLLQQRRAGRRVRARARRRLAAHGAGADHAAARRRVVAAGARARLAVLHQYGNCNTTRRTLSL